MVFGLITTTPSRIGVDFRCMFCPVVVLYAAFMAAIRFDIVSDCHDSFLHVRSVRTYDNSFSRRLCRSLDSVLQASILMHVFILILLHFSFVFCSPQGPPEGAQPF